MRDRRKEERLPALLGATIEFDRGFSTAACTVRDTSVSGARLRLHGTAFLPEEFELAVSRRDMSYRVRRRWRRDGEIGVEIEAAHYGKPRPPLEQAKRMRRLQDENAVLRRRIADLSE